MGCLKCGHKQQATEPSGWCVKCGGSFAGSNEFYSTTKGLTPAEKIFWTKRQEMPKPGIFVPAPTLMERVAKAAARFLPSPPK